MNLYVDDVRQCPPGWQVARTVEAAMALLATGTVDGCSLDHDLGACAECVRAHKDVGDMQTPETTFMHWCPHALDGTKLVRWMIETGSWSKFKPFVHSANPVGSKRMRDLIDQYFGEPAMGAMV